MAAQFKSNLVFPALAVFLAGCTSYGTLPAPRAGTETAAAYRAMTAPDWSPATNPTADAPVQATAVAAPPRIVTPDRPLQCVPYARELSGISIRGDAWTWWNKAAERYERSARPEIGSVLVFRRTGRNRHGHLAVVTRIVSEREILVSHANWLNRGRIHIDTPVVDVSPANDWSQVRVWYTPGNFMGRSVYPTNGFIVPRILQAAR